MMLRNATNQGSGTGSTNGFAHQTGLAEPARRTARRQHEWRTFFDLGTVDKRILADLMPIIQTLEAERPFDLRRNPTARIETYVAAHTLTCCSRDDFVTFLRESPAAVSAAIRQYRTENAPAAEVLPKRAAKPIPDTISKAEAKKPATVVVTVSSERLTTAINHAIAAVGVFNFEHRESIGSWAEKVYFRLPDGFTRPELDIFLEFVARCGCNLASLVKAAQADRLQEAAKEGSISEGAAKAKLDIEDFIAGCKFYGIKLPAKVNPTDTEVTFAELNAAMSKVNLFAMLTDACGNFYPRAIEQLATVINSSVRAVGICLASDRAAYRKLVGQFYDEKKRQLQAYADRGLNVQEVAWATKVKPVLVALAVNQFGIRLDGRVVKVPKVEDDRPSETGPM